MHKFNVAITCINCTKQYPIEVNWSAWQKYVKGMHVQHAFPKMKPELRELLISKICPTCWDMMFPEEDDDVLENECTVCNNKFLHDDAFSPSHMLNKYCSQECYAKENADTAYSNLCNIIKK